MSDLYDLPNGWEWTEWKKIVNVKNGKHYKEVLNPNGKYPIYGSGGIIDYSNEFLCKENSVIIGRKGTINNPLFVKEKFWNIDTAFGLESNEEYLMPMFLFYFSKQFNFLELNTATTLPSLTKTKLQQILMPLPPLSEQQRIVSKLDNLFEKIDKSIALHQKNMDDADIFMGSVLNDVFGELEEKYEIKTVDELCSKITDGTHSTPKYTDDGVHFLSVKNISQGIIDFSDTKYVSQEEHLTLSKRCNVEKNDILYTKVGTTGIAKVVDTDIEFSIFVSIALLKPKNNLIESMYFQYILNSPNCYQQSQSRTRGMANRNLVLKDIKQINFPLPPLHIQQKVVKYLDEVSEKIEKVKSIQKEKMDSLKALKASILDKAFRGEL